MAGLGFGICFPIAPETRTPVAILFGARSAGALVRAAELEGGTALMKK